MLLSADQALGLTESHLVDVPGCGGAVRRIHVDALNDFVALREHCAAQGVELAIASSYRSFDRQLALWNQKMRGERPVLDDHGQLVVLDHLSDTEKLPFVLRWTALPGCSRHHWGSDLDVYDLAAMPQGYSLQLVPEEYAEFGPFHKLGRCFDDWFANKDCHGFFRPYAEDRGGVAVEPWHISHRGVAGVAENTICPEAVQKVLARVEIEGRGAILEQFEQIWQRYVYQEKNRAV